MAAQCHSAFRKTDTQRDYLRAYVYVTRYCVCADAPAEQMKSLDD